MSASSLKISEEALATPVVEQAEAEAADLSQDLADIISSFSPQETPPPGKPAELRRTPHYRVRWNAVIAAEGQAPLRGFINDISTEGASFYLERRLLPVKATLHIHIPTLSPDHEPRLLSVPGNIVYVVHDSNQQMFRAAISFSRFQSASDKAYLEERLDKYHVKIPEL